MNINININIKKCKYKYKCKYLCKYLPLVQEKDGGKEWRTLFRNLNKKMTNAAATHSQVFVCKCHVPDLLETQLLSSTIHHHNSCASSFYGRSLLLFVCVARNAAREENETKSEIKSDRCASPFAHRVTLKRVFLASHLYFLNFQQFAYKGIVIV